MSCGASGRKRWIAYTFLSLQADARGARLRSLSDLKKLPDLRIYNTESQGPIHGALKDHPGYVCSEYFGPEYASGQIVNGVEHQDLMHLGFASESLDVVISSDVLEHIPEPYTAHREIYRALRPGGSHVFTVPFYFGKYRDEVRARIAGDGTIEHILEPQYHGDGLRPEGILAYTIFSLEMLPKLAEIGFHTNLYRLSVPRLGIMGTDAIVFAATKPA